MKILIIGCGVSGLSTGISLLRAGYSVEIWTRDYPLQTTSSIAPAIWYPYKVRGSAQVARWGRETFEQLQHLATVENSGVLMTETLELNTTESTDAWWAEGLQRRKARPEDLPPDRHYGFLFTSPVIDMPIYLQYLLDTFLQIGGFVTQRTLDVIDEAFAACRIIINCSGLGARELVHDQDIHACRGQLIRIKHNGYNLAILDEDDPQELAYIVPRTQDIILGGTDEDNNENIEPDPEQTQAILQRCARLVPQFAHIREEDILSIYCGLRPARSSIRLEVEETSTGQQIIHNYGHAGSGVTLSWGCAAQVVAYVHQIAEKEKSHI